MFKTISKPNIFSIHWSNFGSYKFLIPGMLAAGRLCEMVGSKALDVDRFVRQWRGVVVFSWISIGGQHNSDRESMYGIH